MKKRQYTWVRYRDNWAYRKGGWQYHELCWDEKEGFSYKKVREMFIEEINDKNRWSEHYRGCDVVKVKSPPKELVEQLINRNLYNAKYQAEEAARLKKYHRKLK